MKVFSIDDAPVSHLEAKVPVEVRLANQADLIRRQQRLFEKNKEITLQLSRLHAEYKDEIRNLVGPEKFDKHAVQYRELLARMATLVEKLPRTFKREKEQIEHRKQFKDEKQKLYQSFGFDVPRIVGIRKTYLQRAREMFDRSVEPEALIPAGADTEEPKPTSNPWTYVFPPFSGGWTNLVTSNGSKGTRQSTLTASPASGEIHLWSRQDLFGADDDAWSEIDIMAEVYFWFQMPAAGSVDAHVYYRNIDTDFPFTGELVDETGWSGADVAQHSQAYIFTSESTEAYSFIQAFRNFDDEGSWAEQFPFNPGEALQRHFYSNRDYASGEWVYVAAGIRDRNHFNLNDMGCRSVIRSRWFVDHVVVRSTGAL